MSVNPFDIRTALLAKHAQHVVLIHFPIALFTAAVAFDYLGAVDEQPDAGCGGVFQSSASCGLHCANRGHRSGSVAMGA